MFIEILGRGIVFGIGTGELIIVMIIVLILFGVGRLPEIGSGLGQGIRNFRKAMDEGKSIDVSDLPLEKKADEEKKKEDS